MGYPAAKIRQFLEAIEPEVIIECPACQTKFRIEASKLEGRDDSSSSSPISQPNAQRAKARFHCSRCDYVFSAEIASASTGGHPSSSISSTSDDSFSDNLQDTAYTEMNNPNNSIQEEDSKQEQADFPGESELTEHIKSQAVEPSYSGIDYQGQNSQDTIHSDYLDYSRQQIDRNMGWDSDVEKNQQMAFNFTSPKEPVRHQDVNDQISSQVNPQAAGDFWSKNEDGDSYLSPNTLSQNTQHNNFEDISEAKATNASEDIQQPWLTNNNSETGPDSPQSTEMASVDYSKYAQDFREEDNHVLDNLRLNSSSATNPISSNVFSQSSALHNKTQNNAAANASQRLSTATTLAIFILPIAIALTLLGASTLYLGKNLKASEKLLSLLFPKTLREAPSGVFVQQPRIEPLVLDSGDIVNIISGTIVNQSKKTLTALTIEGLGFSDSGQINISERVLVGNPVSTNNATLKTLTPSNIRELQSKEPKNFLLRPDAKTKFILVFTKPLKSNAQIPNSTETLKNDPDSDGNISSFAVRVYSARFRNE